jgi:DNA-binding PadR family transcriptional regulator
MIISMVGGALKGHLDLLLLAILADRPEHGYAVVESLRS